MGGSAYSYVLVLRTYISIIYYIVPRDNNDFLKLTLRCKVCTYVKKIAAPP